jgi:hypothetical protein
LSFDDLVYTIRVDTLHAREVLVGVLVEDLEVLHHDGHTPRLIVVRVGIRGIVKEQN